MIILSEKKVNADEETSFLYLNNSGYLVTDVLPTFFGTHLTKNNPAGEHPKYFTLGDGGIGGLTYLDTNNFFLSSGGSTPSQAVNVTLPNSLDISYVKTLTIKLNASHSRANLINDSANEWFTLYGVNTDGTIANDGVGFEFNNTNIPSSGDNTLVLTYDQFKYLADDNGIIKTLQWNYWDNKVGGAVTFIIQSIEYKLYENNELKNVTFKNSDGKTLSSCLVGNKIPQSEFAISSSVNGFEEGLSVEWKDDNEKIYDSKSYIEDNIALYPTLIKDITYYTKYLYSGKKDEISISKPTSYINSAVQAETEALDVLNNQYYLLYTVDDSSFAFNAYAGYQHGAVDVTFNNPIRNVRLLKNLKINLSINAPTKNGQLIYIENGIVPYYRLYGFNKDGNVKEDGYIEFNNDNVNSFLNITVEFNSSDLMNIANEDGEISKLQWNCYNAYWYNTIFHTFTINSITYEEYADDEYHTVNIYDTDKITLVDTVTTPYSLNFVKKSIPLTNIDGYPKKGFTLYFKSLLDDSIFNEDTVITDDIDVYSIYERNKYLLKFDSNGGLIVMGDKSEYLFEEKINIPNAPTRIGYVFDGWYEEGCDTLFDFSSMPDRNVVLYAKWIPNSISITVSKLENGNVNIITPSNLFYVGNTIEIEVIPNEGYYLNEVYLLFNRNKISPLKISENKYSFEVFDCDVTIKAIFSKKVVSFNILLFNGGYLSFEKDCYTLGETVKININSAENYKIDSLLIDGEKVEIDNDVYTFKLNDENVNIIAEFSSLSSNSSGCSSSLDYDFMGLSLLLIVFSAMFVLIRRKNND